MSIAKWWMNHWRSFESKHPKASKIIYQIFYFIVFSEGVTIFQYLVFTFLPKIFGLKLAGTEFMWPQLDISLFGFDYKWNILGYDIIYNKAGEVAIGGRLGYFLSYEIGTFLAQCINFPLQRNITFKSHGNPALQGLAYFIAWILISLLCNAVNGLWMPIGAHFMSPAVYNILVTFITGGISMIIFFFVFKIIFPEGEKKEAAA